MIIEIILRMQLYVRYIILKIKLGKLLETKGFFTIGKECEFEILEKGRVCIGEKVEFSKRNIVGVVGGKIFVGSKSFFNDNCRIICRNNIQIGDNCIFGPGVTIYDHDHIFDWTGIKDGYKTGEVVIDSGCWIGTNVTILRNTHIGEKSVIGAGTTIKGDIPAHSRVVGTSNLIKTIEKTNFRDM